MARPASSRPCPDPDCRGLGEPEQDGDHQWQECTVCGYSFVYIRLTGETPASGEVCAVGISEDVRRRASLISNPPVLQIGRRDAGPA